MVESTTSPNDYKFEQVHTDWSGLRTQVVIGLLSLFVLCLINFVPFRQDKFFGLATGGFIDFTLYFVSCSVVVLITLAIGRVAGNRNGAGCAIWSALLFSVSPWQAIVCLPAFRMSRIISCLILLSIFFLFHSQQKTGKVLAFISLVLAICCSLYFETHHVTVLTSLKQLIIAEYVCAALILCGRVVCRTLNWRTAVTIILWLLNAVIASEIFIYPGLIISAGAVQAIALALACLPALGAAPVRINRLYGGLGLIVLSLIAVTYELLFIGY